MNRNRIHRVFVGSLAILAIVTFLFCAAVVSRRIGIVVTSGVSMNPVYYQGDLVVVANSGSYEIGEIAAYPVPGRDFLALHRIIAGDASGFTFKGDNNQSIDPSLPAG
jgi:signal peptidase I